MPQSPRSAKEIFLAALDCQTSDALQGLLQEACGEDVELRQQVEGLLRAYQQAGNFLGGSASFEATIDMTSGAKLPYRNIGPYKLLQQIGEGGMGSVYMAEQTEPIHRKVALKLIRAGLDSQQTVARFEAERQALALMDHQNIAKVLDAGTTETGQPYFVMELVHGLPLTKYCDERRLSPRERLELFIPVCHAVQHAHQKGVIHRDLKPSNVLVATYDGRPVPKVIDFGVAKALGQKLTDKTMFTEFGSIVGTLEYMSPEQAEQSHVDIDTRSDIYSLGVMLYELLTGSTPLDRKRLKNAAILELLRIIKDEEPQKPSTRLSTTDALPSIAANRNLEPRKLSGIIRGELDWIVMKALEKDRDRRYETANGFAADVQRFLQDEPVTACPPSARYRFRKFARRNKGLLAGVASVGAALVAGIVISTILAVWALQAEDLAEKRLRAESRARTGEADARRQAEKERDNARAAEQRAASERDRAEVGFAQARTTVDEYLTQVSENQLLTAPGLQPLRRELLESALKFYEEFLVQRGDDPAVRRELAAAQLRVSKVYIELGMVEEYRAAIGRATSLYEALQQADPQDPDLRYGLAMCFITASDRARAMPLLEILVQEHPGWDEFSRTLAETYNDQATFSVRDPAEVLRLHQRALALKEQLVLRNPENLENRTAMGNTLNNLGVLLAQTDLTEAMALLRRAAEQFEFVYARSPHLVTNARHLARAYGSIGICHSRLGNPPEAGVLYQRATDLLRKLALENPSVPIVQGEFAAVITRLATWQREQGQLEDANRSLRMVQQVLLRMPRDSALDQYNLACVHAVYAQGILGNSDTPSPDQVREARQESDRALAALQQALTLGFSNYTLLSTDKDLDSLRKREDFQALLTQVQKAAEIAELTKAVKGQGPSNSLDAQQRALELRRELAAKDPQNPQARADLASNLHAIGVVQSELEQWEPAATSLAEAGRLRAELVQQDPQNLERQVELAATLGLQSHVVERQGQSEPALTAWNQQRKLLESLRDAQPQNVQFVIALGKAWYARGNTLWDVDRFPLALPCWTAGFEILDRANRERAGEPELIRTLASSELNLSGLFGNHGHFQLAAAHWIRSNAVERNLSSVGEARFAIVAAWMNDRPTYDATCRMLVEKFGQEDPLHAAWACTVLPECPVPPDQVVRLAEEGLRRDVTGTRQFAERVLALSHLRNGQFDEAKGKVGPFLEAVVLWKQADQEGARKALKEAERSYAAVADRVLKRIDEADQPPLYGHRYWWEELSTRLSRKEAWELIEGRVPPQPSQLLVDSVLWTRLGNTGEADKALQAAMSEVPAEIPSLTALAESVTKMGRPEWALAAFGSALDRQPDSAELWMARARHHLSTGNKADADADFTQAANRTPDELSKFVEPGWWVSTHPPDSSGWIVPQTAATATEDEPPAPGRWHFVPPINRVGEARLGSGPEFKDAATRFGVAYVYSPDARSMLLLLGGYAPFELQLNGRLVYQWKSYSTHFNLDRVPVLLRPGRNTFVVRLLKPLENKNLIFRLGDSRLDRGLELAQLGLWEEALPLLRHELEEGLHLGGQAWSLYSGLVSAAGEPGEYREFYHKVLGWMSDRPHADAYLHGSNVCALEPVPEGDVTRLVQLVDKGVAETTQKGWPENSKPRVYFRAGRYQEALNQIGTQGGLGWYPLKALCWHHLGDAEKARQELKNAETDFRYKLAMKDSDPSTAGVQGYRHGVQWLAPHYVLLREARKLIAPGSKPDDSPLHQLQAQVRKRLLDADPQLRAFEVMLIHDDKNPQRWLDRGQARAALGHWDLAQADFAKAVEIAPEDVDVLVRRGHILAELTSIEEPTVDFLNAFRALDVPGSNPEALAAKRRVSLDLARWPIVQERVAQARPDDPGLTIGRARQHVLHGRWKEAADDYARVAGKLAEPDEWLEGVAAPLLAGRPEESTRLCQRMVDRHGQSTDPATALALVRTCCLTPVPLGDVTRLVERAQAVLKQDPKRDAFPLALAQARAGQWEPALATLTASSPAALEAGIAVRSRNAFLLALVQHHLSHSAEAERARQDALRDLQILGECAAIDWLEAPPAEWLTLNLLRAEVETRVVPTPAPAPAAATTSAQ